MCPNFLSHKHREMKYSVKRVLACTVNSVDLRVLFYNKTTSCKLLQQLEVHSDQKIQKTLSEQRENIGQIITEIYCLREELAKRKLTLKQGFVLIDETCAKHAMALDGLSCAGAQSGTMKKFKKRCNASWVVSCSTEDQEDHGA